jgi:hypothetical protein
MVCADYTLRRKEPPKYIGIYTAVFFWIMILVVIIKKITG